ncbi:hypothetical protein OH799_18345 [Nocardia sp. NBC_00881]|uniref:hypothetical protein n=1 Tax=Nocardia sp. NBC_00881 TaxID=2975995 RepID=UPI00386FD17B|nr:hypothetical protein OH799_18345 [Nocardia sp. NBC_00881]
MNSLVLVGIAGLATGLLTLVVAVLLRPTASHRQLTVAELRGRLAKEAAVAPPANAADDEPQVGPAVAEPLPEQRRRAE